MSLKAGANLTLAEIKIAFRNTEAIVFSYGLPAVAIVVLRLLDVDLSSYFSGIIFGALLIVAFFGTTDWIVILKTTGILKRFSRYNLSTHTIWFSFLFSRLIIILIQIIMLTLLASALIRSYSLIISGIIYRTLIAAIPLLLLGILTASIVKKHSVRPICGSALILGIFLSGAFYHSSNYAFNLIGTATGFSTYFHLIANQQISTLDWGVFGAWSLSLTSLNYLFLKKIFMG